MRRLLQIYSLLPYPPDDGGRIAMWNLSRSLAFNGVAIDLVCFVSDLEVLERSRPALDEVFENVYPIVKPTEEQNLGDLLRALYRGTSYFTEKYRTRPFEERVRTLLEQKEYDAIWLEPAHMGVYLPVVREALGDSARVILRLQNVEHEILERLANGERNPVYRWLLHREARLFQRYETDLLRSVPDVRAISERDARRASRLSDRNIETLEPFLDLDNLKPCSEAQLEPFSLVCVGNMAWLPNRNGVRWFLDEVWPGVRRSYPQARFYAVGKRPPKELQDRQGDGIVVTGYVEDVRPYFERAHLFIVPLLEGSGIRIKIIMAMALGKEILSTRVGAEGIEYPALKIADGAEEWLRAIQEVFAREPRLDLAAAEFARARYSWRRPLSIL